MDHLQELIDSYKLFKELYTKTTHELDLTQISWLYPTTTLPLIVSLKKNSWELKTNNNDANSYFKFLLGLNDGYKGKSLVSITKVPKNIIDSEDLLQDLKRITTDLGKRNVYEYLIGELIDNIYEHSDFNNAYFFAQIFPQKKFIEFVIIDDGCTIPGSFRKKGLLEMSTKECIMRALDGYSTKKNPDERGFGLGSTLKLTTEGLDGCYLIITKDGGYFKEKDKQTFLNLKNQISYSGTMISIRVPFPIKEISNKDFYKITELK